MQLLRTYVPLSIDREGLKGKMIWLGRMILICALSVVVTTTAIAHDWYDKDCCHQQDCAPILKETKETVTTAIGTANKKTLMNPVRPSKDYQDHACLVRNDDYGSSLSVRCIYRGSAS